MILSSTPDALTSNVSMMQVDPNGIRQNNVTRANDDSWLQTQGYYDSYQQPQPYTNTQITVSDYLHSLTPCKVAMFVFMVLVTSVH